MRDTPNSQQEEILRAMQELGINPSLPITEEQMQRVKGLVWTHRRADQQRAKEKATQPRKLPDLNQILHQGGPESPPEEVLFWAMSHRSLLIGEFKPQFKIGPYFVDFGFPDIKLAIEVDGRKYHSEPADIERDNRRAAFISSCGWLIQRFPAREVFSRSMDIADEIGQLVSQMQKKQGRKEAWERRG